MDHSKIVASLGAASLFELYQLQNFIGRMLNDPKRIQPIRAQLKPNQIAYYVDLKTQQEIKATVLDLGRTHVGVRNHQDGKAWRIPYYMFKVEGNARNSNFSSFVRSRQVDRLTLRMGEQVGFVNRDGQTISGRVIKLNLKSATIELSCGTQWLVRYHCLFYVINGEVNQSRVTGAEIVIDAITANVVDG